MQATAAQATAAATGAATGAATSAGVISAAEATGAAVTSDGGGDEERAARPRADRAPERAPRCAAGRPGPLCVPAHAAVHARVQPALGIRPRGLLRRADAERGRLGLPDRAVRTPSPPVSSARQGGADRL